MSTFIEGLRTLHSKTEEEQRQTLDDLGKIMEYLDSFYDEALHTMTDIFFQALGVELPNGSKWERYQRYHKDTYRNTCPPLVVSDSYDPITLQLAKMGRQFSEVPTLIAIINAVSKKSETTALILAENTGLISARESCCDAICCGGSDRKDYLELLQTLGLEGLVRKSSYPIKRRLWGIPASVFIKAREPLFEGKFRAELKTGESSCPAYDYLRSKYEEHEKLRWDLALLKKEVKERENRLQVMSEMIHKEESGEWPPPIFV